MALTKTGVIAECIRRTARSSSDVTSVEVEAALEFLTMSVPALYKECTTRTVEGQAYYDLRPFPKLFQQLTAVRLEGSADDNVLTKIDSWSDYQKVVVDETSADYDVPDRYIIYDDFLYVYPTPDSDDYTLRIFTRVYEDDADDIELADRYREPLYDLVCFEVFKNKGLATSQQAQSHFESFARWLNAFNKLESEKIEPEAVRYTDI